MRQKAWQVAVMTGRRKGTGNGEDRNGFAAKGFGGCAGGRTVSRHRRKGRFGQFIAHFDFSHVGPLIELCSPMT